MANEATLKRVRNLMTVADDVRVNLVYGRIRAGLGDAVKDAASGTLRTRRDEALTDFYDASVAARYRHTARFRDAYEDEDEDADAAWKRYCREHVFGTVAWQVTADGAPLNRASVERIVSRIRARRS